MTLERDFENHMREVLESGQTSREGADAPPADTWQRVLARIQPPNEEEKTMDTATFATPMNTPISAPPARHRSLSRYLNIAATVALVLTIALGGWLAAIRMNQPGSPDPRFAVLPATPEVTEATCDVEPLTQDRVLEIVKNPIPFIANGPAGEPQYLSVASSQSAEFYETDFPLEAVSGNEIPTREKFDSADQFANEYLECLLFGTQSQIWNFYSPTAIQSTILAEFPVFSAEEDVTNRIAERLQLPAIEGEFVWQNLPMLDEIAGVSINPDRNLAILNQSESRYFDEILSVGVVLRGADGTTLVQTNGTGRNLIPNDPMITGTNDIVLSLTLVNVREGDNWYVMPSPSLAEMGNFS